MNVRVRQFLVGVGETFWLLPAVLVVAGILLAIGLVELDRSGLVPQWLIDSPFLYNGGGTGARTLLGAVASSTIGVAGTVFSITIASLSLAAGQMGPRLLRNFVKDRGNQFTLGAFLGTFSYALMVLRSVRTQGEGPFVPHAALTAGILLAFLCVGVLVFFVGHMAGRINVDTVIELVSEDVARRDPAADRAPMHPTPVSPPALNRRRRRHCRSAPRLPPGTRRRAASGLGCRTRLHDPAARPAGRLRLPRRSRSRSPSRHATASNGRSGAPRPSEGSE